MAGGVALHHAETPIHYTGRPLIRHVRSPMTLTLLIALLILACLLGRLKWRRCSRASYGSALLLFLLVGCGPLPALLLSQLQAPYATRPALNWGSRNAIVLLTAGAVRVPEEAVEPGFSAYGRISEAAMLYRQCRQSGASCTVLVTGGDPARLGTPLDRKSVV